MNTELTIEYLALEEIKVNPKNARVHTQKQINEIAQSILKLGFNDPIGLWKDNTIIEGHGRFKALQQLKEAYPDNGYDTVPVIRLDHLTDDQRKAYILAHNQTALNSEWDNDLLREALGELAPKMDMSDFGFKIDVDALPELELEREAIGSGAMLKNLSFGGKTVPMTPEEFDRLMKFFKAYAKRNGNTLRLVEELLNYGAKRYEN